MSLFKKDKKDEQDSQDLGSKKVSDQKPEDNVIDAEFKDVESEKPEPEDKIVRIEIFEEPTKYVGQIISTHEGFSYIGNVRRGTETINTNGDVFVPLELPIGSFVEFDELNTDPKREGKYRTEKATVVEDKIVKLDGTTKIAVLKDLSKRTIYHYGAKEISPDEIKKAAQNLPFAEMIGLAIKQMTKPEIGQNISELAEQFLNATFAPLQPMGVNFSIKEDDIDEKTEREKIDEVVKQYKNNNLQGQVESLTNEYEKFRGVRKVFTAMRSMDILRMDTVIPVKYLPDLLVMAPVWFISAKAELEDLTSESDPRPDHAVTFFCEQVKTREFAWLYQIYNRRTRPISMFKGRDIIPPDIAKIMEQARKVFDYTVIATPYHDIASLEWADPNWLRNLDPFLFGFYKDLPYMFLLGRWSGTGLFPLMLDMVADTIDHLKLHLDMLNNFHANSYWYKGKGEKYNGCDLLQSQSESENTILMPFVQEVVQVYEEGWLFQFLRGEPKPGKEEKEEQTEN